MVKYKMSPLLQFIVKFVCVVISAHAVVSQQICKNEQNKPVDWYVLYKFPTFKGHEQSLIKDGVGYAYITSEDVHLGWQMSNISINSSQSMPGLTLTSLYTGQAKMHVQYNDEPPPTGNSFDTGEKGHTKGVILSDSLSGLWLIHSVPHYPPIEKYFYPHTGLLYGQSFLCISLDLKNLNIVGKQLQYNQPHMFSTTLSQHLSSKLPEIDFLIKNGTVSNPPWYHLANLQTLQGKNFLSFAKSRQFGKDLYSDWISAVLQDDLYVESWLNAAGKMPSVCNQTYTVKNVRVLQMSFSDHNLTFHSSKDHSKWVAAVGHKKEPWICVGDINRVVHQKRRGGGTVCSRESQDLWNSYIKLINDVEPCTK